MSKTRLKENNNMGSVAEKLLKYGYDLKNKEINVNLKSKFILEDEYNVKRKELDHIIKRIQKGTRLKEIKMLKEKDEKLLNTLIERKELLVKRIDEIVKELSESKELPE